ncbi:MAG: HAD-IC family P-type ATPase, partial [Cyanobacteria bacterium J06553_1]
TGTLTKGNFRVTQIVPDNGRNEHELLSLAAQVESQSNHPVAQSILQAYGQPIDHSVISDYEEIAAHGIRAQVEGRTVLAGNDRLLHRESIPHEVCRVDGTVAHLAVEGEYAGHIIIADELKQDAVRAIESLHSQGITTAMLTGDSQSVADRVAKQLGLDQYRAELLPEDKVSALEAFINQAKKNNKKVVFVGDGINDSPVIARADVGMAMGGLGSDAAIETADVVIMTDAPSKVAEAISLARRTLRIVWQNIILAMTVKAIFVALGAIGLATLWEAVFADVGVALLAIFNASRILRVQSVQPAK